MSATPTPEQMAERLDMLCSGREPWAHVKAVAAMSEVAALIRTLAAREARMREALRPFAESLVAQMDVAHHSQDWREETDDTVVSITTSHQRKGMPDLSPDCTLWVGAFRSARAALGDAP